MKIFLSLVSCEMTRCNQSQRSEIRVSRKVFEDVLCILDSERKEGKARRNPQKRNFSFGEAIVGG
jgi:hypothetical protein